MKISISALSIAYGLTPEALRYYEEKGLLSPDRAASSGLRRFSIADVQRLGIIKSLQRQGFSLDEIKLYFEDAADLRDQNVFYIVIMAMTGITHGLQPPFQTP